MRVCTEHESWMRKALRLARRGVGKTSPNPPVGALVVRGGKAVGRGFHARAGLEHAEIVALGRAGRLARGATLYVTLEPCSHYGRTPPCVDAILRSGIARVVAAVADPNPRVRGRGFRALRKAGVEVVEGVLAEEGRDLIEPFAFFIRSGLPFVTLKLAASADGRIATASGASRWITGARARRFARKLRAQSDAIVVGARTVKLDDPRLTARIEGGGDPLRVVVDGKLTTSPDARVFNTKNGSVLLVAERRAAARRGGAYRRRGIEILALAGKNGRVSTKVLMRRLAARGITSVLVEGGGDLAAEILRARLVRKLLLFVAPRILGADGVPMVGRLGLRSLSGSPRIEWKRSRWIEADLLLEGYVRY